MQSHVPTRFSKIVLQQTHYSGSTETCHKNRKGMNFSKQTSVYKFRNKRAISEQFASSINFLDAIQNQFLIDKI